MALVMSVGGPSCRKTHEDAPAASAATGPNILLICVDTLRPDHLGMYGYERDTSPRIDRWFKDGLVFENAYAPEANTTPSVISFLTGMWPQDHGIRVLYQRVPKTLPLISNRLKKRGYRTAAVISNMVLTKEATALDAHFDYFDDYVADRDPNRPVYERKADDTTTAALKWLVDDYEKKKPFFMYIHYIDPHGPYLPPENKPKTFTHDGAAPLDMSKVPDSQKREGEEDGLSYVDRYDEEIAFTDREVGRLLDGFKAKGALDETVVVFVADHGESMMEHETFFTHGYHVYEEIIRVPLAFIGPGFEKARVKETVSIRDIAPTLLKAAGAALSDDERKRVLDESPGKRVIFSEATQKARQWRTMVRQERKWMLAINGETGNHEEKRFYDLSEDAHEASPSEWTEAQRADTKRFLRQVSRDPDKGGIPKKMRWGGRLKAPKVAPGLDDATMEKLKALGYVE